jgi:hypothetical protein
VFTPPKTGTYYVTLVGGGAGGVWISKVGSDGTTIASYTSAGGGCGDIHFFNVNLSADNQYGVTVGKGGSYYISNITNYISLSGPIEHFFASRSNYNGGLSWISYPNNVIINYVEGGSPISMTTNTLSNDRQKDIWGCSGGGAFYIYSANFANNTNYCSKTNISWAGSYRYSINNIYNNNSIIAKGGNGGFFIRFGITNSTTVWSNYRGCTNGINRMIANNDYDMMEYDRSVGLSGYKLYEWNNYYINDTTQASIYFSGGGGYGGNGSPGYKDPDSKLYICGGGGGYGANNYGAGGSTFQNGRDGVVIIRWF